MCVSAVVGDAPCQCFSPGANHTTSPGSDVFDRSAPALYASKARCHDHEPDLCVEGTRGADFVGPQPQSGDMIVSKTHFSAFSRTGLAEQLHAQGLDTLVLAGLTTECCVASSADRLGAPKERRLRRETLVSLCIVHRPRRVAEWQAP